jgi:ABC-type transporter Mla MlaB component
MDNNSILVKNKANIVKNWFDAVLNSYHPQTENFLRDQKDPFANPVGNTLRDGLQAVFDELTGAMDEKKICECLDPVIRIRAVQCDTASGAVAFIFALKDVLHREFKDRKVDLSGIESRIDKAGLIAFDVYAKCRETLHAISLEQERRRVATLLKKAGYLVNEEI